MGRRRLEEKITPEIALRFVALRKEGQTLREIGAATGYSLSSIAPYIRGVKVRQVCVKCQEGFVARTLRRTCLPRMMCKYGDRKHKCPECSKPRPVGEFRNRYGNKRAWCNTCDESRLRELLSAGKGREGDT